MIFGDASLSTLHFQLFTSLLQIEVWVRWHTVDPNLEVQVGAAGVASAAHGSNELALAHILACVYIPLA